MTNAGTIERLGIFERFIGDETSEHRSLLYVNEERSRESTPKSLKNAVLRQSHTGNPISIYIHWPFCKSKCPYCDFNSHVRERIDHTDWINAYLKAIDSYASLLTGRTIQSIFFGGGTPSLAPPLLIELIITKLLSLCNSSSVEITLEANPTSIEANKFKDFREAGVNRVSIGIQSLNSAQLKFLGREHTTEESLRALELVSKYFSNYSFDLIYALPNQTLAEWTTELQQALGFGSQHLSLYQLTIEKGTKFFSQHQQKAFTMPNEELAADFYCLTQEIMSANSMPAYEVSNHAALGHECRHNLNYWHYGDYIGIGPGAHGRYKSIEGYVATVDKHSPESWLDAVTADGLGLQSKVMLNEVDVFEEALMMGLRVNNGIDIARFQQITDRDLAEIVKKAAIPKRLLSLRQGHLKATPEGILVLNSIIGAIVTKSGTGIIT